MPVGNSADSNESSFYAKEDSPTRRSRISPLKVQNNRSSVSKSSFGSAVESNDDEETKINELLGKTDLLEENFYNNHDKESALAKTFVFKKNNNSFSHKSAIFKESFEEKSFESDATSLYVDSYKNNTFVSHVPMNFTKMSIDAGGGSGSNTHATMMRNIQNYKMVTGLLEEHLNKHTNIFHQMIQRFVKYFNARYNKALWKYSKQLMSWEQLSIYIKVAVSEVQQFIKITYDTLNYFYRLDRLKMGVVNPQYNLFNRDNMVNFITSVLFSESLYNTIFELLRINDLPVEQAFERSVLNIKEKPPNEMDIPAEYCLNDLTLEHFYGDTEVAVQNARLSKDYAVSLPYLERTRTETERMSNNLESLDTRKGMNIENSVNRPFSFASGEGAKSHKKRTEEGDDEDENLEEEEEIAASHMVRKTGRVLTVNRVQRLLNQPYKDCIKNLQKIEAANSPVHKMKTIVRTAELVNKTIEKFYAKFNINKTVKLDADQTISIFIYIVANSEISCLSTHLRIIEKFTTSNVLNSISGYYATTIEACVNCIVEMGSNNDKRPHTAEEVFGSLLSASKKNTE